MYIGGSGEEGGGWSSVILGGALVVEHFSGCLKRLQTPSKEMADEAALGFLSPTQPGEGGRPPCLRWEAAGERDGQAVSFTGSTDL